MIPLLATTTTTIPKMPYLTRSKAKALSAFTNTTLIAYRAIRTDTHGTLLVTLEIPPDAKTNIMRADIVDVNNATHRTDKAKVLSIEDRNGTRYDEIYSHAKKHYKVGELLVDSVRPFSFALNKAIYNIFISKIPTVGELYGYHDNGALKYRISYINKNDIYITVYHRNNSTFAIISYMNCKPSISWFYINHNNPQIINNNSDKEYILQRFGVMPIVQSIMKT